MNRFACWLAVLAVTHIAGLAAGSETQPNVETDRTPASGSSALVPVIELSDQFEVPHTLRFPHTNVVVLTLADQKGSKQVEGWVRPLQERFPQRLTLAGVADVSKVPAWLRGRVRAGFREQMPYPVLLDWKGTVCRRLSYERGQVNVLLLDRNGALRLRLAGAATPDALTRLTQAIEQLLPAAPGV
jgi:hypothetical protein